MKSLNVPWKKLSVVINAVVMLLFLYAGFGLALEPPTDEQLEEYQRDGTLAERIENAKALGNDKVSNGLAERTLYKLNHLHRMSLGLPDNEPRTPPPGRQGLPTTGTIKLPVILISFKDYPQTVSTSEIQSKLFGDGDQTKLPFDSLKNFYERSSYNQLHITGDTLEYQSNDNRPDVSNGQDYADVIVKKALKYLESQGHDFSQYDTNNDGNLDAVIVFWAGPDTGWGTLWWGFMKTVSDPNFTVSGKKLLRYNWQAMVDKDFNTFSPRTVIHETGHLLGLPDYYDYDFKNGGVGGIDMMNSNAGDHNCFSKFMLDWITPAVYNAGAQTVVLNPSVTNKDNNSIIVFPNAASGQIFNEYFMVQNRFRGGNDFDKLELSRVCSNGKCKVSYISAMPADGLLIWHVNAILDQNGSDFKYSNTGSQSPDGGRKLLRLMEADGLEEISQNKKANAGDYYITGSSFGTSTTPNSRKYDGRDSGVSIGNIQTDSSAKTIRFDVTVSGASVPMSLSVTSPNGGETLKTNQLYEITWVSSGNPGPEVKIDLLKNGSIQTTIAQKAPNTGSANDFDWTVNTDIIAGGDYKIRITSIANPSVSDDSNNNFSITTGVQQGSLQVTLTPNDAVQAGAKWKTTDGDWQDSGYTMLSHELGTHSIIFKDIPGWKTPVQQDVTIIAGQTAALIGAYERIQTITDDTYENNNTPATAFDLSAYKQTLLSSINGKGIQNDEDWYKIRVAVGYENVQIQVNYDPAEGVIYSALAGASGNILKPSTEDVAGTQTIDFIVPKGDDYYYIKVYGDGRGVKYDLQWNSTVPPVIPTGSLTVNLSPAEALTAGAQWRVDQGEWKNNGDTVTGLQVIITGEGSGIHRIEFKPISGWKPPDTTKVTIEAGKTTNTVGNYTIYSRADDLYEVNNTLETAYDLSDKKNIWLSDINGLGVQLDEDWYKITVGADQRRIKAELQFSYESGDMDIALYDSYGNQLYYFWTEKDNEYLDYTVPTAGIYYLRVFFGNTGNTYNLRWNTEVPNPNPVGSLMVRLYPGELNGTQWNVDDGDWKDNQDIVIDLPVGEHTIKFKPITGYITPAAITATIKNNDVFVTNVFYQPQTDDKYEENDTFQTAYDLSNYKNIWLENINGLGIKADDDYYKIYVPKGSEHITVDLTFKNSEGDIDLYLYDDHSENALARSESASDNERIDYIVPRSNAYYYLYLSYQCKGNQYNMKWNAAPPELESLISVLKLMSGIDTSQKKFVDCNGDGKTGLDDAVYLIQLIAGKR